jgi:hypothetical protein
LIAAGGVHERTPELLLVAGAGASIDFGMPSVRDIHNRFVQWSEADFTLETRRPQNLYEYLYTKTKQYWSERNRVGDDLDPNFEDVLDSIFSLSSTSTSILAPFIARISFPDIVRSGQHRPVDEQTLKFLAQHLVDHLLDLFRKRCTANNLHMSEKTRDLAKFLNALRQKFQLAIATVNYDDIMYNHLRELETGFDLQDGGLFKAERLYQRLTWPCMLHLHGSVHFDMKLVANQLHTVCWVDDVSHEFHQNSWGRSSYSPIGSQIYPTSSIIAGGGKPIQMLRLPFRVYYAELERLVNLSDCVLFAGGEYNFDGW